jgi:hypothetical protein
MVRTRLSIGAVLMGGVVLISLGASGLVHVCRACDPPSPPTAHIRGRGTNTSRELPKWCIPVVDENDGAKYSGTVAYAVAKFTGGTGDPIKKVEVLVNGTSRYTQEWSSGYPSVYPDGISCDTAWLWVPLSTTQYNHGSTLTLKAKVWTRDGQYAQDTDTDHTVWNKAYVLDCQDVVRATANCAYADSKLEAMNHLSPGPYDSDDDVTITGDASIGWGGRLRDPSVFYGCTHGDEQQSYFGDSFCPCGETEDCHCEYMSVSMAMSAKDNDPRRPNYNFVFLDACYSSDTGIWYGSFDTTSFLGWVGPTNSLWKYENWVNKFWDGLAMQKSVAGARSYAHSMQTGIYNDSTRGSTGYKVHKKY